MKKLNILILSLLIPFNTAFPFEASSEEINNECSTVTSVQEYKNCLRRVVPINPNYVSSESISEIEIVKDANDDLYNEAVQAFKDKKENEALSKVNSFLAENPNAKNGYFLRALINAYDFDDAKSALEDLTKAIKLDNNFAEAYAWRADISNYDLSNLKGAEKDIKKALQLSEDDPFVNYVAGGVYIEKAYKSIDLKKDDEAYNYFAKSNIYNKKAIANYPKTLNSIYQRIFPFGYEYVLYYELGLNEYELGWYFKDVKRSTKKGKPFFESGVNSLTLAINLAPTIEETNKVYEDYGWEILNLGELHYWRAETYASYLKGAWWKKPCKDWKKSKEYGWEDSFKPVREYCY